MFKIKSYGWSSASYNQRMADAIKWFVRHWHITFFMSVFYIRFNTELLSKARNISRDESYGKLPLWAEVVRCSKINNESVETWCIVLLWLKVNTNQVSYFKLSCGDLSLKYEIWSVFIFNQSSTLHNVSFSTWLPTKTVYKWISLFVCYTHAHHKCNL